MGARFLRQLSAEQFRRCCGGHDLFPLTWLPRRYHQEIPTRLCTHGARCAGQSRASKGILQRSPYKDGPLLCLGGRQTLRPLPRPRHLSRTYGVGPRGCFRRTHTLCEKGQYGEIRQFARKRDLQQEPRTLRLVPVAQQHRPRRLLLLGRRLHRRDFNAPKRH